MQNKNIGSAHDYEVRDITFSTVVFPLICILKLKLKIALVPRCVSLIIVHCFRLN